MRSNRKETPGRQGTRTRIRPAAGSALTLAAAVLATGFAATASAAPAATGTPSGGRGFPGFAVPAAASLTVTVTSHFVWKPTTGSLSGDSTFLDNGATNGKKKDLLFVMPNLTPNGLSPCPCLLSQVPPIGVWYNGSGWAIFNEDSSDMGTLFAYNVLVVPKASKSVFTVQATSPNTHGNYMIINSPLTNGHPNALLQVTQNFGSADVFNPHNVGVRYFPVRHRWAIFNEDGAAMPHNASFNVLIGSAPSNGGRTNVVVATRANRPMRAVILNNPETNGNPNNVTFATQNFDPGGKGGTGSSGFLIAGYQDSIEGLVNWGNPTIPLKAAFNLLIFSS